MATGCASKNVGLTPRLPVYSRFDAMELIDARTVTTKIQEADDDGKVFTPKIWPAPSSKSEVIGNFGPQCFVFNHPVTSLQAIGGIVANKFPSARVTLEDLRCETKAGMWTNDTIAFIRAKIESGGGSITVRATGKNAWSKPSPENYSLAYERALTDFAAQVNAAPADLSRVVR